jgi:hypothetical protein
MMSEVGELLVVLETYLLSYESCQSSLLAHLFSFRLTPPLCVRIRACTVEVVTLQASSSL